LVDLSAEVMEINLSQKTYDRLVLNNRAQQGAYEVCIGLDIRLGYIPNKG